MILYNEEAEGMVLCALMLDQGTVDRVLSRLQAEDFEMALHRGVYADIVRLHRAGTFADQRAVCGEALKRGEGASVAEIARIASMTYTSANVDHYLGVVKDLAIKRATARLIDSARMRLEGGDSGADISGAIEQGISAINLGACGSDYLPASGYMADVVEQIEWNIRTQGRIRGVDSHFENLREITGFRDGEYIIIAARPSVGKTALALNLIEDIAVRRKVPAGFFSVEMTAKQLELRMISSLTGLNSWAINSGYYKTKPHLDRIMHAAAEIAEAPLYIDETSSLRLSELRTKARRMVHVDKCKILMIDYMSLIDAEMPRLPRHEQVAEVSRSIKSLAKELRVPIIMLSQLIRDSEGKRPNLASLAESRSLEQDADVIMFLHRERESEGADIPTDLIVAKNRNGQIGTAHLIYRPQLTKFFEAKTAGSRAEEAV